MNGGLTDVIPRPFYQIKETFLKRKSSVTSKQKAFPVLGDLLHG